MKALLFSTLKFFDQLIVCSRILFLNKDDKVILE